VRRGECRKASGRGESSTSRSRNTNQRKCYGKDTGKNPTQNLRATVPKREHARGQKPWDAESGGGKKPNTPELNKTRGSGRNEGVKEDDKTEGVPQLSYNVKEKKNRGVKKN